MDAGGRATQDAKADDPRDGGARISSGMKSPTPGMGEVEFHRE
jgi:hypothetical protein